MEKKSILYIIVIVFIILFLASAFFVYEREIPVPLFGAIMGVFITAIVTYILLNGQTEGEARKDKDVKIYEEKIKVYSEFTSKMWKLWSDVDIEKRERSKKYDELRMMCFDKLVFFLSPKRIENLTQSFKMLSNKVEDFDNTLKCLCEITDILKEGLDDTDKSKNKEQYLMDFYNSFGLEGEIEEKAEPNKTEENNKSDEIRPVIFWHFNTLGEEQIKAFKEGNWILNLIEYGEDWRTKQLEQVKPGDVIFLFKRGGSGYIGAFKATGIEILEGGKEYSKEKIAKYDIYSAIADEASFSSNILVEPIAYNYKGVGYYSVRRRTIERMNDRGAIEFLLKRFNGDDREGVQETAMGKLEENISIDKQINSDYFQKIYTDYLVK